MKRGIKHDFTLLAILLIPIGVAINLVLGQIVNLLNLPIFLDNIGTILVAIIAGPWVGLVTGAGGNLAQGIFAPTQLLFSIVGMSIGLVAGFLSKGGMFSNIKKTVVCGLILTVVGVTVATPIVVIVFGGVLGNASAAITTVLVASGQHIWQAAASSSLIFEFIDKVSSTLIAYFIFCKMSSRFLSKHNYSYQYIENEDTNLENKASNL